MKGVSLQTQTKNPFKSQYFHLLFQGKSKAEQNHDVTYFSLPERHHN